MASLVETRFMKYGFLLGFVIVGALFGFAAYSLHTESKVDRQTEIFKGLHELEIAAYKYSEEHYHTQLELWEYVYLPSAERLRHLADHRAAYKALRESFLAKYEEVRVHLSSDVQDKVEQIVRDSKVIDGMWERGAEVVNKDDPAMTRQLFLQVETEFDKQKFGVHVADLIKAISVQSVQEKEEINHSLLKGLIFFEMILVFVAGLVFFIFLRFLRLQRKLQAQLVQADKLSALGQLAAGMAHEINNPLMFIQGFNGRIRNELAKKGIESASVTDYLAEIDGGVERIRRIVNQLRDYSRKSTGEASLVSVDDVIRKSFVLFQEQLKLKNIEMHLDLEASGYYIEGDPNKLEQVFFNLISNARDAMASVEKRPKSIHVVSRRNKDKIEIKFSDSGKGIEKENLNKVFDPFFTTKEVGAGTGLGLSISQGIVAEYGGRLEVSSKVNEGTTFTLTFPAKAGAPSGARSA